MAKAKYAFEGPVSYEDQMFQRNAEQARQNARYAPPSVSRSFRRFEKPVAPSAPEAAFNPTSPLLWGVKKVGELANFQPPTRPGTVGGFDYLGGLKEDAEEGVETVMAAASGSPADIGLLALVALTKSLGLGKSGWRRVASTFKKSGEEAAVKEAKRLAKEGGKWLRGAAETGAKETGKRTVTDRVKAAGRELLNDGTKPATNAATGAGEQAAKPSRFWQMARGLGLATGGLYVGGEMLDSDTVRRMRGRPTHSQEEKQTELDFLRETNKLKDQQEKDLESRLAERVEQERASQFRDDLLKEMIQYRRENADRQFQMEMEMMNRYDQTQQNRLQTFDELMLGR